MELFIYPPWIEKETDAVHGSPIRMPQGSPESEAMRGGVDGEGHMSQCS